MDQPDNPVSFGRKCSWLAIESDDPQQVIAALHLVDVQPSNWKTGIASAYKDMVFVSPPIGKWILVVAQRLPHVGDERRPDLCTPFLLELGQHFRDVQFFWTHRIVMALAWARVIDGQIIRQFSWLNGASRWNVGQLTPEEVALGLKFVDSRDIDWPEDDDAAWEMADLYAVPGESDVLDLAGAWSVDTNLKDLPPSLGYIGRFPDHSDTATR